MSVVRLWGLIEKEVIQFSRDRIMMILILWLYTIEVVICSYALTFDVKNLPLGVVDRDRSPTSRRLTERFVRTPAFKKSESSLSPSAVDEWLQSGTVRVVLVIPENFSRHLRRGHRPSLQLVLDGTDSQTAMIARGYAAEIIQRFARSLYAGTQTLREINVSTRFWFNPSQTTTPFMVLSMIALAGMMVGMIHPAASVVREAEEGTGEQLRVTPIRPIEMFAAKTLPTLIMGLISIFPSLLIVWWFGVPLRGSLWLFLGLTGLFLLSAIGLGVVIAVFCETLQQALLLCFFGLFPVMFLSGTLVPVESMPVFLQRLSYLSPLRHYMDITLGIFMKGAGIRSLWSHALVLSAEGLALFGFALIMFQKRIR